MKLSRLYSNKPALFTPVDFNPGLNVVLGEIRLPQNRGKDTHNLGKTTLGRLIDFVLLARRDPNFFLFKHFALFKSFTFFLEIELDDSSYVTVRRGVDESSRIAIMTHTYRNQDLSVASELAWSHVNVPFERAREILDSRLNLLGIKPWNYRKGLGYLLRSQEDFRDVFQLRKFAAHADWKPFLAQSLGFNADIVSQHYAKDKALAELRGTETTIRRELGGSGSDTSQSQSQIDGLLLLKTQESEHKQSLLDAFDFRVEDKAYTKQLVDEVDEEIASLNARRYSLTKNRKKIVASLDEGQIRFDPDEVETLFREARLLFAGQIKKDFEQLIAFNKAISDERRGYLQEERSEIESELKQINASLQKLGQRRTDMLSFLSGTDIFLKYKQLSTELVNLRVDIASLERQRQYLQRIQELQVEIRTLTEAKIHLQTAIEADVDKQNSTKDSLFSTIRLFFNRIVEEVIDRKALLSVSVNSYGYLEFSAEILDEAGNATSADMGHTYRKLLGIAFDMAVVRAHMNVPFPRFVFHDGVFESLDDRKKENLLAVIREYADIGIQLIITAIDSDLPRRSDETPVFSDEEIVLRLHDESDDGRLFKMDSW